MKSPKLLPWQARKAGVCVAGARRSAVEQGRPRSHRRHRLGWHLEFWGAAETRFRELLDAERSTCAPQIETFVRCQSRLGLLPLLAAEQMVSAISANWQRFCNQMSRPPEPFRPPPASCDRPNRVFLLLFVEI